MGAHLNPYLSFTDNARQAMEFYHGLFGGTLNMNTFGDFGQTGDGADLIMHAQLEDTDHGFTLMAADTPLGHPHSEGSSITISLSGDEPALRTYWEALSDGGTVTMPLDKQPWGDEFGMCTDEYGTPWMVNISQNTTD